VVVVAARVSPPSPLSLFPSSFVSSLPASPDSLSSSPPTQSPLDHHVSLSPFPPRRLPTSLRLNPLLNLPTRSLDLLTTLSNRSTSHSGPSYQPSSNFVPGHHPSSSSLSSISSFAPSPFNHNSNSFSNHSSHPSLSAQPIPSPYAAPQTNHTRILLLSAFDPSLKTKDLQEALAEWQDEPGGLKVKWRDDTSAWVIFGEAAVGTSFSSPFHRRRDGEAQNRVDVPIRRREGTAVPLKSVTAR
jgi:hypothetical protein